MFGTMNLDEELKNGLVGHWKMRGNTKDSSHFLNHGTVNGATLTTDRFGRANAAYAFNGSSSIDTNMGIGLSAGDFSVNQWVRRDLGGYSIAQLRLVSPIASDWFFIHSSSLFWFRGILLGDLSLLSDANYHMLTMTWNASTAKYKGYCDGVYLGESEVASDFGGVSSIKIGRRGDLLATGFTGSIGDTRIYNRALSQEEITKLFRGVA